VCADCRFGDDCSCYLTFDGDGGVYPCEEFADLPGYRLGNVLEEPLDRLLASEPAARVLASFSHTPERCLQCSYRRVCMGGCVRERLAAGGPDHPSVMCQDWRELFECVREAQGHCWPFEDSRSVEEWTRARPASN
ncbi:MAG: SPASM domain-containing protein, partial [Candidatus Eremiobacterota bacterium]